MFDPSDENVRGKNEEIKPIPDDVGLFGTTRMGGGGMFDHIRGGRGGVFGPTNEGEDGLLSPSRECLKEENQYQMMGVCSATTEGGRMVCSALPEVREMLCLAPPLRGWICSAQRRREMVCTAHVMRGEVV